MTSLADDLMPGMEEMLKQMALDPFSPVIHVAKALQKAEEEGKPAPPQYDLSVGEQCFRCFKQAPKAMLCGGCKGVLYYSKECQKTDWSTPKAGAVIHKELCPRAVKFMEKLPYYRDTISQFPWGRIEKDGSTSYDLILARHSLLGASVDEFGYWASPSGISPHDFTRSSVGVAKGYDRHGAILLKALPDEVEGWKLASELCPRLLFDDECEPPTMPGATVVDWKSWYDWRRIKLESPVALLMDYPLSVYWLLIKVLDVVPLATLGAAPTERRSLLIHYIGAEQELNFLPIFSELSLLIPNTDITIVFYGAAVRSLVLHARKSAPRSPAALPTTYSYRAPKSVGESTFTAKLFAEDDDWKHPGALLPDAIVGMNAGLVSDPGWQPVLIYATGQNIPFAITEYAD